jgi:ATP-dependent Clp protease adaptor protein ClpS
MTKENTKSNSKESLNESLGKNRMLILHNDEINSFDFVIETLVKVCKHDEIQAEQCAFITHYKGKCDVKKGSFNLLKPMKDELINKGLSVTIED